MEHTLCMDCDYCRSDRKNDKGQVRCTRYSQFVSPNQKSCDKFYCGSFYVPKLKRFLEEMQENYKENMLQNVGRDRKEAEAKLKGGVK